MGDDQEQDQPSILPKFQDKSTAEAQPLQFTVEKVESVEVLENEWEPLLVQIFPDETDREPIDLLTERLEAGENFFLMRDAEGKAVGMELSQILLDDRGNAAETGATKAMYIPWTGVLEEYRNLGIGSHMNRQISDYMREEYGITHTLIDIEDPARMHNSGYDPEELPEAIDYAERRINFWRREGFFVVDDENTPTGEKLEYCRPASDDESQIQAYDHMTVRFDNEELRAQMMNADGTGIDKAFARQCFLDMNRIQYGDLPEDELRAEYPAVDKYLKDIDSLPGNTLAMHTSPIRQKTSPVVPVEITMKKPTGKGGHDHRLTQGGQGRDGWDHWSNE